MVFIELRIITDLEGNIKIGKLIVLIIWLLENIIIGQRIGKINIRRERYYLYSYCLLYST